MGGLSLLLLAGQQAMGKSPTTPPLDETSPPEDTMSEELSADTNSRLFEFAEVNMALFIIHSTVYKAE